MRAPPGIYPVFEYAKLFRQPGSARFAKGIGVRPLRARIRARKDFRIQWPLRFCPEPYIQVKLTSQIGFIFRQIRASY